MRLFQIMKRGANKLLSNDSWHSAKFETEFGRLETVSVWFRVGENCSRYRVDMTRDQAEKLHGHITEWLERGEQQKGN